MIDTYERVNLGDRHHDVCGQRTKDCLRCCHCPLFMCCRLLLRRRIKYLIVAVIVWQLLRYFRNRDGIAHTLLAAIRRIYTLSSAKLPVHWWTHSTILISVVFQRFPCCAEMSSRMLSSFFPRTYCLAADRVFASLQYSSRKHFVASHLVVSTTDSFIFVTFYPAVNSATFCCSPVITISKPVCCLTG